MTWFTVTGETSCQGVLGGQRLSDLPVPSHRCEKSLAHDSPTERGRVECLQKHHPPVFSEFIDA